MRQADKWAVCPKTGEVVAYPDGLAALESFEATYALVADRISLNHHITNQHQFGEALMGKDNFHEFEKRLYEYGIII